MMTVSNDFLSSLTGAVAIVPIIIALVQAVKMLSPKIDSRFAPILSIGFGIAVAFLLKHDAVNLTNVILEGVLYGLSASGLYSGVQVTMNATQNKNNAQTAFNGSNIPNSTQSGSNIQSVQTTEKTTTQAATTTNPNPNTRE